MRRHLALFTVAALVAAAAPAGAQVYPERIRLVARDAHAPDRGAYRGGQDREEQVERFTRTVKIGDRGWLDVSNVAGDIVITRASGAEATIEVVKTARARTTEDAQEALKLVTVEIQERGNRVEVRTRYPGEDERRNRRNLNVSVAYTIAAPEGTRLTVNSVSGDVSVREIRGELNLESVSGNVTIASAGRLANAKSVSGNVQIADTAIEGTLAVSSVSGTVIVRRVKAQAIEANSVSGDIVLEQVTCDRVDGSSVSGTARFSGPLAADGRYELKSHSGDVRVMLSGDTGFELNAQTFSGSVRSDLPLKIGGDADRGRRSRSLRGVYGDGSAILDLTSFSGSIAIGKS